MIAATTDIPAEAFRKASLESERSRIHCLLLIMAVVLMLISTRALITGIPEQRALLPRFIALISIFAAYEGVILALVLRAIRRDSDLPSWAWFVTTGVEALIPTAAVLMLTGSPFIGPYRALAAPAAHAYYFFILLSALRLRPILSFLTGLASALGLAAPTAYTVLAYPASPNADNWAHSLQINVTYCSF